MHGPRFTPNSKFPPLPTSSLTFGDPSRPPSNLPDATQRRFIAPFSWNNASLIALVLVRVYHVYHDPPSRRVGPLRPCRPWPGCLSEAHTSAHTADTGTCPSSARATWPLPPHYRSIPFPLQPTPPLTAPRSSPGPALRVPLLRRRGRCLPPRQGARRRLWRGAHRLRQPLLLDQCHLRLDRDAHSRHGRLRHLDGRLGASRQR